MRTKTQKILIFLLLTAAFTVAAFSKDYTVRRKIDGYTMDVAINRNPPVIGRNEIKIEIKDPLGKHAANAAVTVNYYMPPMPGMPPMNYTVKALPSGSGYKATMDLVMTGPWNVVIKADTAAKQLKMTAPIDVR